MLLLWSLKQLLQPSLVILESFFKLALIFGVLIIRGIRHMSIAILVFKLF